MPVPVAANTNSWDWFGEPQKDGTSLGSIVPVRKTEAAVYSVQGKP